MNRVVSTNDRLLLLETEVRGITEEQKRLSGVVETFIEEVTNWRQRIGRPNWQVITSLTVGGIAALGLAFSIFVAGLSLMWFLVTGQINSNIAPLRADMAYVRTVAEQDSRFLNQTVAPAIQDLTSKMSRAESDRSAINAKVDQLQETDREHDKKITSTENALKEIETQFRSNDEARNIQFAEQQRTNSNFQNTFHDIKAPWPQQPSAPFYQPHVAKPSDSNN